MNKNWMAGFLCLLLACVTAVQADVIFSQNFAGPGTFEALGWAVKQGWYLDNAASRAVYSGGAANAYQWFEKDFDSTQSAQGLQLDFSYEWQWGSQASWCQFQAELVVPGTGLLDTSSGYSLRVKQGGENSYQLYRLDGTNPYGTLIAQGNGYSDAGCQWAAPNWKSVRLTWDAATGTIAAYKMVDGQFVEVLSVVDTTYDSFGKIRFNEITTGGEVNWITNVELQSVPEPATMSLLGLGGLALLRRRIR